MKLCKLLLVLLLSNVQIVNAGARKELFDRGWRFDKGSHADAVTTTFDDSSWRLVDLPHDWSIEPLKDQIEDETIGPFSKKSPGGPATGQTLGGEGWYRKSFVIAPGDKGKRHELYFEGVYNQSEVWINGRKANSNVYGYSTFRFDITPYCKPTGQKNVVVVKVINEGKNSRWYSGSGIYRHVWLIQTSPVYIDDWGTYIKTNNIAEGKADISLTTKVINTSKKKAELRVQVDLLSPAGIIVAKVANNVMLSINDSLEVPFKLTVNKPALWSTDSPNLYTSRISLWKGKNKIDEQTRPLGIRTIAFSVEKGFELNGIPVKLRGGCVHHDNGLLGAMAFDRAEERKITILKKNGFNAVRGSHNPMSEAFLAACDRLGMLVVDEAFDQWNSKKNKDDYHQYFKDWSAKDIKSLILRDRNHPSVIMWSIGNEIPERNNDKGRETAGYLRSEIRKYDDSRPVTAGVNKQWDKEHKNMLPLDNAFYNLDVAGYNYMWRFYEVEHEKFPNRIMYGSESVATEASQNWDKVEKLPYVIGDFVWTAQDYLGESGIGNSLEVAPEENVHQFMGWPWFNGWCGDIDILGVKKPQSYYRDVLWRIRNISMATEIPAAEGKIRRVSFWGWADEALSWTYPGMESKMIKVNVYTRYPQVRLYLNDSLIAEGTTNDMYKVSFNIPYQKGQLKAIGVTNGHEFDSVALSTVGQVSAVRLVADKTMMAANGQDLSFVLVELVDKDGNVVYDLKRKIKISSEGNGGRIIASGNASPNDMQSFNSLNPNLYNGRGMVILRSSYEPGEISLKVECESLKPCVIKISTQ